MLGFFSNKQNFNQDQTRNKKSDRQLCKNPDEVPKVMHTKFPSPSTSMVLEVISNKGDTTSSFYSGQPQSKRQGVHQGTKGKEEILDGPSCHRNVLCLPTGFSLCPQGRSEAELACNQLPVPLAPGLMACFLAKALGTSLLGAKHVALLTFLLGRTTSFSALVVPLNSSPISLTEREKY